MLRLPVAPVLLKRLPRSIPRRRLRPAVRDLLERAPARLDEAEPRVEGDDEVEQAPEEEGAPLIDVLVR